MVSASLHRIYFSIEEKGTETELLSERMNEKDKVESMSR